MADSAGKGNLIVAVCHGLAQLEARWDSAGARAIWDTAGIKVILGGITDPDTLERLSRLCGELRLRIHSRSWYDDGRRGRTVTYEPFRVLPPELLRGLPEWRALVIRGNLSPGRGQIADGLAAARPAPRAAHEPSSTTVGGHGS